MKKISIFLITVLTICITLIGCAADTQVRSEPVERAETRIITDMLGREIEIPVKIESVAAAGSTARILTYANCVDKITGVTDMDKTNNVNMPYSVVNAELFANLPSIGAGGSKDVTYEEELVILSPDIIITNRDINTINELQEKTGIPVIGLAYEGVFDDSVYNALTLVGEIMGTKEHCAAIITQMKTWQEDLHNRTKDIANADKPTVYTGGVSYKGAQGFEGTYGAYPPFTAINAKNVVDETGKTGAMLIDIEKVTVWDPDIIFLNPTNMYLINEDYKKNKAVYDNLTAVREGHVYSQISYNYNSTNIEIAIADAYYAGKIIFPEQFKDINPETKADEIFKVMLGQSYYDRLVEAGIGFGPLTIGK